MCLQDTVRWTWKGQTWWGAMVFLLITDSNAALLLNAAVCVWIRRLGALWHTTSQIHTSVTVEVDWHEPQPITSSIATAVTNRITRSNPALLWLVAVPARIHTVTGREAEPRVIRRERTEAHGRVSHVTHRQIPTYKWWFTITQTASAHGRRASGLFQWHYHAAKLPAQCIKYDHKINCTHFRSNGAIYNVIVYFLYWLKCVCNQYLSCSCTFRCSRQHMGFKKRACC